ncbi:MAG: hypothetical protein Q8S73_09720 [Deltaproteobacteria bacterium]|nr:hypothetical protein [Myxococcales bacterium]MDP3214371.1 hypothetical protein [Deltaproteobacteria bacterium]
MSPASRGFRTIAAHFAVLTDDLPAARDHLRAALSLEGGAVRRARLLLLQSRVLAVLGEAREADAVRAELLAMEGGETEEHRRRRHGHHLHERPHPELGCKVRVIEGGRPRGGRGWAIGPLYCAPAAGAVGSVRRITTPRM